MKDLISRADAIEIVLTYFVPRSHTGERGEHEEDFVRTIFKALPSAEQVTSKLKNPCDSLLTDDSDECKEQKSKLESAEAVQSDECDHCVYKWGMKGGDDDEID